MKKRRKNRNKRVNRRIKKHVLHRISHTHVNLLIAAIFLIFSIFILKFEPGITGATIVESTSFIEITKASCDYKDGNFTICADINWGGEDGYYAKGFISGTVSLTQTEGTNNTEFTYCQDTEKEGTKAIHAYLYNENGVAVLRDTDKIIKCEVNQSYNETYPIVNLSENLTLNETISIPLVNVTVNESNTSVGINLEVNVSSNQSNQNLSLIENISINESINESNEVIVELNLTVNGKKLNMAGIPNFKSYEEPIFDLNFKDKVGNLLTGGAVGILKKDINAVLTSPDGSQVVLGKGSNITDTFEGFDIKIGNNAQFRPGLYRLVINATNNNNIYNYEQDFTWGVLAINTHKSIYLENEETFIGMAVLDEGGNVVCNAGLTLEIIDPYGNKRTLTTANHDIKISDQCQFLGVTKLPDYYTNYTVNSEGTYVMNLTAVTQNGIRSILDHFVVQKEVDFDVARDGPTRIYPPVNYTMNFIIKANKDFKGEIKEAVPRSFEIYPQQGLKIIEAGDLKILMFDVDFSANNSYNINYGFDAPDVSPEFYVLGPLEIGGFREARNWQIASDAISVRAVSITEPLNNSIYLTGEGIPGQFNFTCNISTTGSGSSITATGNWSFAIKTLSSSLYKFVNSTEKNLTGNISAGTWSFSVGSVNWSNVTQTVNASINNTYLLKCMGDAGKVSAERVIIVNMTPRYNYSVRVYQVSDGTRNATIGPGGTVTLLNDRTWNVSIEITMNQTDSISNLSMHNAILSGLNYSVNVTEAGDQNNGSVVDANSTDGYIFMNKTWKKYNFTTLSNPSSLHNFTNGTGYNGTDGINIFHMLANEVEMNSTSYTGIAFDDSNNVSIGSKSLYVQQRYEFVLDQNEENVDNFTIIWAGTGVPSAILYIWNGSARAWDNLSSIAAEGNITFSSTTKSSIRDYINETNGELIFIVRAIDFGASFVVNNITTDFIELTTGANSSSVLWHPRGNSGTKGITDIEYNDVFNLTFAFKPQNVTQNIAANLTFGSSGKAINISFNINLVNPPEFIPPRIQNPIETPDPVNPNNTIELNISCTDNDCNKVIVQITQPNGSLVNRTMSNVSNNITSYFNLTTYTHIIGNYTLKFYANDSSGNINNTVVSDYIVNDSLYPNVTSPTETPDPVIANNTIELNITVTDNVAVGTVIVQIQQPNASLVNRTMTLNNGRYFNLTNYTHIIGQYNLTYYANDSGGLVNRTEISNYVVNPQKCGGAYNESTGGDFNISGTVTCTNQTVNVTGSVNVLSSGNLTLNNATIFIASSSELGRRFFVYTASSGLHMYGTADGSSMIRGDGSRFNYTLTVENNDFQVFNSSIRDIDILNITGNGTQIIQSNISYLRPGAGGILIRGQNNRIIKNNISRIGGVGINISLGININNTVAHNLIQHLTGVPIRLEDQNNTIFNNTIRNVSGTTTGIIFIARGQNITSNIIEYVGSDGINAPNGILGTTVVDRNNITGCTSDGIDISSSDVNITNNLVYNCGSVGVRLPTSGNHTIVDKNNLTLNDIGIVMLSDSNNITNSWIAKCTTDSVEIGTAGDTADNNLIQNNNITNGSIAASRGAISLIDGNVNRIVGNLIFDMIFGSGSGGRNVITILDTDNNVSNNVIGKFDPGSSNYPNLIGLVNAHNTTIAYNILNYTINTVTSGIGPGATASLTGYNVTIIGNNISDIGNTSIYTGGGSNWYIADNILNNNSIGILVATNKGLLFSANDTNISRNVLANSTNYSILIYYSSNVSIINNTLINNTIDFNITGVALRPVGAIDSTVHSLNNSFNRSKVSIDSGDHLFNVSWFVRVNVTNDNRNSVASANATVKNSTEGFVVDDTTDSDGLTRVFQIVEVEQNATNGNRTLFSPHNFTASNISLSNATQKFINMSQIVIVFLGRTIVVDTTPPNITNMQETPDPINPNQTVELNATCQDDQTSCRFINVQVTQPNGSLVNLSTSNSSATVFTNRTIYTHLPGTYTLNWYANDSVGNTNRSESSTYLVNDTQVPNVTALTVTPLSAVYGNLREVNVIVADNVQVETVIIQQLNMTVNYTTTLIAGVYKNRSVNTSIVGNNTLIIYANDTNGNRNNSEKIGYTVFVTPLVTLVNSTPISGINDTVFRLNASVVFNGSGSAVAEIKYPNGTFKENVSFSNSTRTEWNGTVIWTWNNSGTHNFTIFANDTNGGNNNTEIAFYIPFINFTTENGIKIDGDFTDWDNKTNISDETGDQFGSASTDFDIRNARISNNDSYIFFYINVSGAINMRNGNKYYRIYFGNSTYRTSNSNDTAPNNGQKVAVNYTHIIQINGTVQNTTQPCGIYNYTFNRIGNCTFTNSTDGMEISVLLADLNTTNLAEYRNITFETGNSTDRFDLAPNYKSFVQFVVGDAALSSVGILEPANNTVFFTGGNQPYSFNYTCNTSVTGGGTASVTVNWTYKIKTFASNYLEINSTSANLTGNNAGTSVNTRAAGDFQDTSLVNTTNANETFLLRCEAKAGTTRLQSTEVMIYVNRTPDFNGTVRVYNLDGTRNTTAKEFDRITLLNDRKWNFSIELIMNQTDSINNLTIHNVILSGINRSANITPANISDFNSSIIVDVNVTDQGVYSNKTWKEYNFTDINGSFGSPSNILHNFTNGTITTSDNIANFILGQESEQNATSYHAISYDDSNYINITFGLNENGLARFVFILDENEENINNFTFRITGFGPLGLGTASMIVYIWNHTLKSWDLLGTSASTSEDNVTFSTTSKATIRDYLNESSGEMAFLVRNSGFGSASPSSRKNLVFDYVQLTVGIDPYASIHWHPRVGNAFTGINITSNSTNFSFVIDPQNVTENHTINLTFGSSGKPQNFSFILNFINPTAAAGSSPYVKTVNLVAARVDATPATINTTDQLNCTFVVQDNESTSLDVNVTWFNGSTIYTSTLITVTNATNSSSLLTAGLQAKVNNWTCSCNVTDGTTSGTQRNDSITVINSPPLSIGLKDPLNNNQTTNRTPFFYWTNTTDADDDTNFTFTINLTCNLVAGGLCSPNDNKLVNTSNTGINLTNANQLRYFLDDGAYYNWTVTVYDNNGSANGTSDFNMSRNISINALVSVTLPNSTVQFGNKTVASRDDTTDNSPQPAFIQNDGNSFIDVNETSSDLLFDTRTTPSSNFQYRIDNVSEESGSFNSTNSPLIFVNVNDTTSSYAVNDLNYSETNDTAEIEFRIEVPTDEPPGDKSSLVTLTGFYAGRND